jgi:hypothetical protein
VAAQAQAAPALFGLTGADVELEPESAGADAVEDELLLSADGEEGLLRLQADRNNIPETR